MTRYSRCRYCGEAIKMGVHGWEHADSHPARPVAAEDDPRLFDEIETR